MEDLVEMIKKFDETRAWDLFSPAHSILHLIEELGEVSRCILYLDKYKTSQKTRQVLKEEITGELADSLIMLIKISNLYDIDLVNTAKNTLKQLESSVDIHSCFEEVDRYVNSRLDEYSNRKKRLNMIKIKFGIR
ncbi:MAG: hypothetical protein ACTSP4_02270 [Candidatus Hodarchaeales archaeon]